MERNVFDMEDVDIAWCPGCGNFGILNAMKQALTELELKPEQIVVVSGIGQAAKAPHYYRCNLFNGLHGRSLPVATAIKAVNPELTVIVESGDGCSYAEGGNHFIHAIRRNPDITYVIHNNMVYGLTKGQASPTSPHELRTPIQIDGVFPEPFNPIAVAVSLDASFVARAFAGDVKQTKDIIKEAIQHKGYAIVDVLQPCVTYNKLNTYKWFKENTYYLDDSYDPTDRMEAFKIATDQTRFALGVIYKNPRPVFHEGLTVYKEDKTPIYKRDTNIDGLIKLIGSMKG